MTAAAFAGTPDASHKPVLEVVPEPSTWAMFGLGGFLLVATLRRRTQVQIDAGVEAVIAIEPLDNSETKVEHVPLLKGLSS